MKVITIVCYDHVWLYCLINVWKKTWWEWPLVSCIGIFGKRPKYSQDVAANLRRHCNCEKLFTVLKRRLRHFDKKTECIQRILKMLKLLLQRECHFVHCQRVEKKLQEDYITSCGTITLIVPILYIHDSTIAWRYMTHPAGSAKLVLPVIFFSMPFILSTALTENSLLF